MSAWGSNARLALLGTLLCTLFLACSGDDNGGGGGSTQDAGADDGSTEASGPCDCSSLACQAPPLGDQTVVTSFYQSTRFIYEGVASGQCVGHPMQTGVATGTIDAKHAAALIGKIADQNAQPVAGATITVVAHPEFGQTISAPDGSFVLIVNGGAELTAHYAKTGDVSVQRHARTEWLTYSHLPDVVMRPASSKTNAVTLGSASSFADGDAVTDSDGSRTSHVYFAPNTTATAIAQNGTKTSLSSFHLRMTELTTGATGPASMPADLPPATAYTYCTSFDVDEAPDAQRVELSPSAVAYVDDFLGFNPGTNVPAGAYVPGTDAWEPGKNGVALKVLTAGDAATVDADGDGKADTSAQLAALGITSDELVQIGSKFSVGAMFWRVPLAHFSVWDFNPGWSILGGAHGPALTALNENKNDCSSTTPGSIIHCESASLGEVQPLTGAGISLMYSSERQRPYEPSRSVDLLLSDATIQSNVERIEWHVDIDGEETPTVIDAPTQYATATFTWDGKNGLGLPEQGTKNAIFTVDYVYSAYYSNTPGFSGPTDGSIVASTKGEVATRQEVKIERTIAVPVTAWDERPLGENGWTIAEQHVLDPINTIVHFGYGDSESVETFGTILTQVGGQDDKPGGNTGDGGPATSATFYRPHALVVSGDGSTFISDEADNAIRKIDVNGIVSTIAGTGVAGFSGDGGPATAAQINTPFDITLGPDGAVYFADSANRRVRKIAPNGIISTVAGTGTDAYAGDGGPALSASFREPHAVAFGPEGSLYVTDTVAENLRRIAPDGTISTVCGANVDGTIDVEGPASAARLSDPTSVVIGGDGSIYVTDYQVVWKILPNGMITRFAGTYGTAGFTGDGGPANQATFTYPHALAIGLDGTVFITDDGSNRVRAVDPSGVIRTAAGGGSTDPQKVTGPALGAGTLFPRGVTVAPDGSIWFTDFVNGTILRFSSPKNVSSSEGLIVPSRDGKVAYVFDTAGHHLKTVDAVTGVALVTFNYDTQWRVASTVDRDGNTTTFARDGSGCLTSVTSPWGHVTTLTCDANGFLASASDPANEKTTYTYDGGGMMLSRVSPRGDTNTFVYDNVSTVTGRLLQDNEPWGGSKTLRYTPYPHAAGWAVDITTAEGRDTSHQLYFDTVTGEKRQTQLPDGHYATQTIALDSSTHSSTEAGLHTDTTSTGDPRYDMMAPVGTANYSTLGGNGVNTSQTRAVTLGAAGDPTTPTTYAETATVGGNAWTRAYDASSRTWLVTTPAGRTEQVALDAKGHVVEVDAPNRAAVRTAYDPQGRVTGITQDARSWGFTYDARSNVQTASDPLTHTWHYAYDAIGRTTGTTRPDGQSAAIAYDVDGNVSSITPPGKTAHDFTYSAGDVPQTYKPPTASGTGVNNTTYAFSQDLDLSSLTRADSQTLSFGYDTAGRLSSTTSSVGISSLSYDPTFGSLSGVSDPSSESTAIASDGGLLTGITWSGPVAGAVGFQYDNVLRVSQETAGGSPIAYGYDLDSLVTTAGAETLSRFPLDGYLSGTSIGAASDALTFSEYGELATYTASISGTAVFTQDFTRDALGRVTSLQETIDGATHTYGYTYDLADRLATVTIDGAAASSYTYDANGNATSTTVRGVAASGSYDAQDRVTSYGGATFDWTAQGELLGKHVGGSTTSYATDSLGRLQSVTLPTGHVVSYVYDGSNRRVGKKIDGVLQQGFLYRDAIKPVVELDGAGNVVSRFVYGSSPLVPDYVVKGGNTYKIFADQIGSPRVVVDVSSGSIVERIDYDERRNTLNDTNAGFIPFGFAGGIVDRDTGLIRFGARDYDASVGRWLTKEPLGFMAALNFYVYADDDPVNALDVTGLNTVRSSSSGGLLGDAIAGWNMAASVFSNDAAADWNAGDYGGAVGNGALSGVANFAALLLDLTPTLADLGATVFGGAVLEGEMCPRTEPASLAEQVALREAQAGAGERIMQGKINDPRYPEDEFAKMQHVHRDPDGQTTTIHYWQNLNTGETSGFKFK